MERIREELRKEMSRREDRRRPVSIALQDGTTVSGIVLGTPGKGTTIAPSAIRRVSMRRATNPWVRGAAGLIAFGGGVAVGVAMGRAKTVEWETR